MNLSPACLLICMAIKDSEPATGTFSDKSGNNKQERSLERLKHREATAPFSTEMEGFEPSRRLPDLPHFECGPFSHLGTSPDITLPEESDELHYKGIAKKGQFLLEKIYIKKSYVVFFIDESGTL